jgi:chromosome segregation ATPase
VNKQQAELLFFTPCSDELRGKGTKMQKKRLYLTLLTAVTLAGYLWNADASAQQQPTTKQGALAAASDKKSNRTYRTTPEGEGALTEQMIEQCIRLNMDVDSSYSAISKSKESFDALNKELTEMGERLKSAKDDVDRGGKEARVEYDAKVLQYNSRLPDLDKQLDVYKKMVKAYQEKSDKFDRECNSQPYYEDDYAAMVKKMGRGM